MRSGAIKAVIFDLDDTLYPERDYVRSGYRAVAAQLRKDLNTDRPFDEWLWERFLSGKSAAAFDAMNAYFRLGLSRDQILALVDVYRRHEPQIRPYDDVPNLLEHLRRRHRLGLLTDGFLPAQRLKLRSIGLEGGFDATLFTEDLGRGAWKPSKAGFEHIRHAIGAPNADCVYVGDNPGKDFVAPNALGWQTVQFVRPGQLYSGEPAPEGGTPQFVVRTAQELCEALVAADC